MTDPAEKIENPADEVPLLPPETVFAAPEDEFVEDTIPPFTTTALVPLPPGVPEVVAPEPVHEDPVAATRVQTLPDEPAQPSMAPVPPEQQYIYVAKVGAPLLSGWLRVEDMQVNPMLTYRSTVPTSLLPPGAPIVTWAEVEAW